MTAIEDQPGVTARATRLWVARHAPAVNSEICYGRTDVAVQIAPENAAETLLASYRGSPPQRIWSSPASRCRLVAACLAEKMGIPLTIEDALGELHFGAWEGRTWTSIQTEEHAAFEAWMTNWQHVAPPGGERPADLEARVRKWLDALARDDEVDCVLAHSGVVRALCVVVEGCSWPDAMRRQVPHLQWTAFSLTQ